MRSIFMVGAIVMVSLISISAIADESLAEQIKNLESVIGGYPPRINSDEELVAVKKRYTDIKSSLDSRLKNKPHDKELLFQRGHLQSMGHNIDYPGAWEGASNDLALLLKQNPDHVPAIIELATLWVDSNVDLAPKAEKLFRGAQCYSGPQPLEDAQRGIYFALYYQGKVKEALRQSEFLIKTWPENEEYKKLNEVTHEVFDRLNNNSPKTEQVTGNLVMASCNN